MAFTTGQCSGNKYSISIDPKIHHSARSCPALAPPPILPSRGQTPCSRRPPSGHKFGINRSMRLSSIWKFLPFLALLTWDCQKTNPRPLKVDSIRTYIIHPRIPTGDCIGNSIIAGHPWRYSGLEIGELNYPDSAGQIAYQLSRLTEFRWIDRGWGGQTTVQIKHRFLRDAIGDSSNPGDGRGPITLPRKPTCVVI